MDKLGELQDVLWSSPLASVLEKTVESKLKQGTAQSLLDMVEFLRDSADIIEQHAMQLVEDERCQSSQST